MYRYTLFILLFCVPFAMADQPNIVEEAETLRPGIWTFDISLVYRDEPVDFGVENRDAQLDFAVMRFSFGLGKVVELQLTGATIAFIDPLGDIEETENNSGDWAFATKVWLFEENKWRPNTSFYYSVKLPNASDEKGSGTDETDFTTFFLFDKTVAKKWVVLANFGLGILGDPFTNAAQNDIFTYGLGADWFFSKRQRISFIFGGETGPRVGDDPSGIQLSYTRKTKRKWAWYLSAGKGFEDDADNFRVYFGIRRGFKLKNARAGTRRYNW